MVPDKSEDGLAISAEKGAGSVIRIAVHSRGLGGRVGGFPAIAPGLLVRQRGAPSGVCPRLSLSSLSYGFVSDLSLHG